VFVDSKVKNHYFYIILTNNIENIIDQVYRYYNIVKKNSDILFKMNNIVTFKCLF